VNDELYRHIGSDWTEVAFLIGATGLARTRIATEVAQLVKDGLIFEEVRGGRVRRTGTAPPAPKRPRNLGLKADGPNDKQAEFDVTIDILQFLNDQYEPVTTREIAYGIYYPTERVAKTLTAMESSGKVARVEEDLWVSLD
jgi:hypothetical protein